MKFRKYLIAIFGAIALLHLTAAFSGNAQQKFDDLKFRYESNEFKLINKKLPFVSSDATLSQLSDTSKANKKEKEVLDLWLRIQQTYQHDEMMEASKNQPYLANIYQQKINSEENIFINLYQGKLTFGDANKLRKNLSADILEKIKFATTQNQQFQIKEQQRKQQQQQIDSQRQEQCKYLRNNLEAMLAEKNNIFKQFSEGLTGSAGPVQSRAANQAIVDENNRKRDQTILQYQSMIGESCGG